MLYASCFQLVLNLPICGFGRVFPLHSSCMQTGDDIDVIEFVSDGFILYCYRD